MKKFDNKTQAKIQDKRQKERKNTTPSKILIIISLLTMTSAVSVSWADDRKVAPAGKNTPMVISNQVPAKPAVPKDGLGMATHDDVPIYPSAESQAPNEKRLYRYSVVKVGKPSKDGSRLSIESEFGSGWVSIADIDLAFDRKSAKDKMDSDLGMAWFFERFNQGTNFETMSFETESFSTEEVRALLKQVTGKGESNPDSTNAAQSALASTILKNLSKDKSKWGPQEKYFASVIDDKNFWLNVNSTLRRFWEAMPIKYKSDSDLVAKTVSHGSYLIYDQFSGVVKNDPAIAKEVFKILPEQIKYASEKLKNDEAVVLTAAIQNPLLMEHASKRLRDNPEIFKKIAPVNAMSVQYASDRLKKDPKFIIDVCSFRPWSVQYAATEILDNEAVFTALVKKDPVVMTLASEKVALKVYPKLSTDQKQQFYHAAPASLRSRLGPP